MTEAERGFAGDDDHLDAAREAELEASGGEGPEPDAGGLFGSPEGDVSVEADELPVDPEEQ